MPRKVENPPPAAPSSSGTIQRIASSNTADRGNTTASWKPLTGGTPPTDALHSGYPSAPGSIPPLNEAEQPEDDLSLVPEGQIRQQLPSSNRGVSESGEESGASRGTPGFPAGL